MFEFVLDNLPEDEKSGVKSGLISLSKFFELAAEAHIRKIAESLDSDQDEKELSKEIVENRIKIRLLRELHDLGKRAVER